MAEPSCGAGPITNAYVLRTAALLWHPVAWSRIHLSRVLAGRGAQVTGVEPARSLYDYATELRRSITTLVRPMA